jgi:hypothetical protein
MRISIDRDGKASLEEPDVFTSFSVLAATSNTRVLDEALAALGRYNHDGDAARHVFVDQLWLVANAGDLADDKSWRVQLDGMVSYARTKGWVDDDGRIRAHVEYVGPAPDRVARATD